MKDLSLRLRALLRRPRFTAFTLLTLALGIGATTAIFTLLEAVFLRPLSLPDMDRLVSVFRTTQEPGGDFSGFGNFSYPDYVDFRDRTRTFSQLALFQRLPVNLAGGSEPLRATGLFVTPNYFATLGVRPGLGRFFEPSREEGPEDHSAVVLSHGCWQSLFAADPDIVGREVFVNGRKVDVIGVAPRGFAGTEVHATVDVWIPIWLFKELTVYYEYFDLRGGTLFRGLGRLAPGSTPEAASAELMAISHQLNEEYVRNREAGAKLIPLRQGAVRAHHRDRFLGYGRTLMLGVGLILLVSCANVGSLLLIRGSEASREVSICRALGASRWTLLKSRLLETALLFASGGLLSLIVAHWAVRSLWRLRPPELEPSPIVPGLDLQVLLFAAGVTLVTGLVFGLWPAVRGARQGLQASLRQVGEAGSGRRGWRPRQLFVAAQLALAFAALLAGSSLLRHLKSMRQIELGFRPQGLLVLTVAPGDLGLDESQTREAYGRLLAEVESLPGVERAALSENRLLRNAILSRQVYREGESEPLSSPAGLTHGTNVVSDGFFATAEIPLVAGRDFEPTDCAECPGVVIVNRTLAEQAWPGEDAIGKGLHLTSPRSPVLRVVGVAENVKHSSLRGPPELFVYLPLRQAYTASATLHVRVAGRAETLLPTVRRTVQTVVPGLPVTDVQTMSEYVERALWLERTSAHLMAAFALLAAVLAAQGVYGAAAYSVAQRGRELAIRIALGARRVTVISLVLREMAWTAIVGLAAGATLSWTALAPLLTSQTQDPGSPGPSAWLIPAILLVLAVLGGCYFPARRAARIPPATSMRTD